MNIIIYDSETGEILRVVDCPESMKGIQCGQGESFIEGQASDDAHYVDGGELMGKTPLNLPNPPAIVADGVDTVTISDIPAGVFVTWPDGEREEVTDGVVEFATTQPGFYPLAFDGVQYLSEVVTIEASA